MRHGPADVVPLTLSVVVSNQQVAKVEDEADDDAGEGSPGSQEDDEGSEDGIKTVLHITANHEPSNQETCEDEEPVMNVGGLFRDKFSVEKHQRIAKHLAKKQSKRQK